MSATVRDITVSEFATEVLESAVPVVVDFWAAWCGPCRAVTPEMEKVAAAVGGRVKVVKVNIDEQRALAVTYHVMSIPTLIIFERGREVARHAGFIPARTLVDFIEQKLLAPAK